MSLECNSSQIKQNVLLDINNVRYECKKDQLIEHSDFFKAMFSGNFDERPNSEDGLAYVVDFE